MRVVALQGAGIVQSLVPEQGSECPQALVEAHQDVPEVMSDLMTEMPEQRAVILAEQHPPALALDVVGLRDVEGDEAAAMAREDRRPDLIALGRIDQEIEGQTRGGVLVPGHQRKVEAQERVEQPVLGGLDLAPAGQVPGDGEVRHHVVVPAGDAVAVRGILGNQPIAGVVIGVGAEAVLAARIGIGVPEAADRFHRRHLVDVADIAQPALAALAMGALEADRLVAGLALEDFHGAVGRRLSCPPTERRIPPVKEPS